MTTTKTEYFTEPIYGLVEGADGIVGYRVLAHITADDDPEGYANIIGTFPNEKEANATRDRLTTALDKKDYVPQPQPTTIEKRQKVPGSGRKALDPEGTKVITARLTAEQYLAWQTLGAAWLREQLQAAFNNGR